MFPKDIENQGISLLKLHNGPTAGRETSDKHILCFETSDDTIFSIFCRRRGR